MTAHPPPLGPARLVAALAFGAAEALVVLLVLSLVGLGGLTGPELLLLPLGCGAIAAAAGVLAVPALRRATRAREAVAIGVAVTLVAAVVTVLAVHGLTDLTGWGEAVPGPGAEGRPSGGSLLEGFLGYGLGVLWAVAAGLAVSPLGVLASWLVWRHLRSSNDP